MMKQILNGKFASNQLGFCVVCAAHSKQMMASSEGFIWHDCICQLSFCFTLNNGFEANYFLTSISIHDGISYNTFPGQIWQSSTYH